MRTDGKVPFLEVLCIYENSPYLIKFYPSLFHINLFDPTNLKQHICCYAVLLFCFASQQQSDLVDKKRRHWQTFSGLNTRERVLLSLVCGAASDNTKAQPPNTARTSQNNMARKRCSGPFLRPERSYRAGVHLNVKTDIYWQQQCALHSLRINKRQKTKKQTGKLVRLDTFGILLQEVY